MRNGTDNANLQGKSLMLTVSQAQLDEMAMFMRQLREFLMQRSKHPGFTFAASSAERCEAVWRPLLPDLSLKSEYEIAVRLSYALGCSVHGRHPGTALTEGEIGMKGALEDWGVLRFSEFDL